MKSNSEESTKSATKVQTENKATSEAKKSDPGAILPAAAVIKKIKIL